MNNSDIEPETFQALKDCVQALDDRKCENLVVLDVRGKSTITDFLIIVSGNSAPHLRALNQAAEKAVGHKPGKSSRQIQDYESGWVVTDGIDFVIHIFTPETRDYFRIESLWKDATVIDPQTLLSHHETKAR